MTSDPHNGLLEGRSIGHYRILGKLGEGGMGEVYRAIDTKLDRAVALKVLPQEFTSDPERLARFEREAKLLAQLHHPNIASIFGLEEANGVRALVMELVPGPTLAERLESGPLPFTESLSLAFQIAQALEDSRVADLSADGKAALLAVDSESETGGKAVYLRSMDGAPPVSSGSWSPPTRRVMRTPIGSFAPTSTW